MLDSTGLEHVSTNMYVIFLTSISADQAVAVTSGTEPVLHIAEGATQGPYLAEADLNLVVPASNSVGSTGRRIGNDPNGVDPAPRQVHNPRGQTGGGSEDVA